ncbi:MAG: DUF3473 domain-containing protein, partial [Bdellovibrionales bacterium]|nr:DUF3473 domain-containing protein [Bdellovibrionales bacterium]
RRHPEVVRAIAARGHEIASHGYGHRLVYSQTDRQFYRDVYRTKRLLEDIVGCEVRGYRAPNFSITERTPWAYDCLIRAGYTYDSSRYPVRHPRYGNRQLPRQPERIVRPAGSLEVFPLSVAAITLAGREVRVPVAGGAYWRLLPLPLMTWGLDRIIRNDRMWCNCYLHPWELDAGQPVLGALPTLTRIRHYGGTRHFAKRLEYFLERYQFGGILDAAEASPNRDAQATSGKDVGAS